MVDKHEYGTVNSYWVWLWRSVTYSPQFSRCWRERWLMNTVQNTFNFSPIRMIETRFAAIRTRLSSTQSTWRLRLVTLYIWAISMSEYWFYGAQTEFTPSLLQACVFRQDHAGGVDQQLVKHRRRASPIMQPLCFGKCGLLQLALPQCT